MMLSLRFYGIHQVIIGLFLGLALGIVLLQQTQFHLRAAVTSCEGAPDGEPCECPPPSQPGEIAMCYLGYCTGCAPVWTCCRDGSNCCAPSNCENPADYYGCPEGWTNIGAGYLCAGTCCCNKDTETCEMTPYL